MSAADLTAVGSLALACAVWGLVQLWVARRDPGNPGVARECDGGCLTCASRGDDDCPLP